MGILAVVSSKMPGFLTSTSVKTVSIIPGHADRQLKLVKSISSQKNASKSKRDR